MPERREELEADETTAQPPAGADDADVREEISYVEDEESRSPEDERVSQLIAHTIDVPVLAEAVERQEAADAADTLEDLEEEEAADVLEAMDEQAAAEALAEMEDPLAAGVIADLLDEDNARYAGQLLRLMAPDDAADLLQALVDEEREQIYGVLRPAEVVDFRRLVGYDEDTAAGLMTTDFLALRQGMTVGQAVEAIRGSGLPEEMHHLPVVDDEARLVGVIGFRPLLLTSHEKSLSEVMDTGVKAVRATLDQEAVAREFDRYDYYMLPVVDDADRLLGIVTVDDVIDIIREEQTEDVQKTVGAGAEEAVYSGLMEKFKGRFPWLIVSVLIMLPSALIVFQFEWLIGEQAILAVLMPVIAAVAGNAGHQALAVTQRGLVLQEVRRDRVLPLLRREALVGVMMGIAVGGLLGLVIALIAQLDGSLSWKLGLVVLLSMTLSLSAGALAGSSIPLVMRRLGFDPAQSSAIFVIMITDAVAFATFLGTAYFSYKWLAPDATPI